MASIKGIIVEIGGDTSELQKALSKVNSSTSSLSRELKGVNSLLKLDPKNTELVAQKQQILKENIEETSKKIEGLRKAQEMADRTIAEGGEISQENYRNLQREIVNTENKLKELKVEASNWTNVGRSIEEFGNKVTDISNKLDKMGTTLTTSLTLPIAGIATAAVTVGNSFEAQMSRVQAIAGATKDELKLLTEQAVQLGAETSFGASEVAQGMENLASAGFTTKEIMEAMPGMLDLAASSGTDLATSSEIAASAIRGFGLEASNAIHIADVYAEAAARTNAQTEDMGEAMKYIAPVANTMGISLEETAAAIGIMSDAGIKGSQAGTSLRGALTRLTKPTDKMLGIMEDLGLEFYDNNGKMKSLTEMTAMLQEKTKGLTDEQKQNALTILFGTESLSGMLSLINRGSDELSTMTNAFKKCNGAASKMADTMLDNTSGAIEEMKGAFESAGIAIQQALAPEIRDLAKKVQNLVDDFNDLTDEEKENIIKTVALVAAIGPAVKILGTLGKGLGTVSKGLGTFSQALLVAKNNTTSQNEAVNKLANGLNFLRSPLGLITVAIAGATTASALLLSETNKNNEAISNSSRELEKNKKIYNELVQTQNERMDATLTEIDNTKKLSDELKTLVDENGRVKDGYKDRVSFILNELNQALGTEYSITGDVISNYNELTKSIEDLMTKKRANAILENEEIKHNEAMEKRTDAYDDMISKEEELTRAKQKLLDKEKEYEEYKDSYWGKVNLNHTNLLKQEIELQRQSVKLAEQNLSDTKQIYNNYLNDIATYESDFAIVQSGNNDKINEMIKNRSYTYKQSSDDIGEIINHNIKQVQYEVQQFKLAREQDLKNQDEMNVSKNQMQIEAGNKQIETLANQLVQMISTTEQMTPQQVEAWKNLANSSYEIYSQIVSKMSPEMQQKIQDTTRVIAAGTPQMQEKAEELGRKTVEEFDKSADAKQKALNTIAGYLQGLSDEEKRGFLKQAGIDNVDIVLKELDKGKVSEENGRNILEGLWKGLKNNTWQGKILGAASGLAQAVNKAFTGKDGWDEHSPSKKMKKFAEYYIQPISDVMNARKKGIVSTAQSLAGKINDIFNEQMNMPQINDFGKLQGSMKNKIVDSTKTVFTTPQIVFNVQELDEAKLNQCFNYINKKFGSAY